MNVSNYTILPSLDEIDAEYFHESGIPAVVILSILMVVGGIGNSHILMVYGTSKKMAKRQAVRIFILWVSAIDLIACVACIPFEIYNIRFNYTFGSSEACKFARLSTYALSISSIGFLTAIAIQRLRYTEIHLPRTTAHQSRVLNIISATIVVICTVLSVPTIHFFGIEKISTNFSELIGTECTFLSDNKSIKIFKIYGATAISIGTSCFIICVVCYGKILYVIFTQIKAGTNANGNNLNPTPVVSSTKSEQYSEIKVKIKSNKDEVKTQISHKHNGYENGQQLTIGLITTTTMSYIGGLIHVVACLVRMSNPLFNNMLSRGAILLLTRAFFIHYASNPVMFLLFDGEFRKECLKLYKKTKCSKY